ncbi:MAG: carboxypeptidase regulatory-like domain-containing protein [Bryobacteraceae bacterium]
MILCALRVICAARVFERTIQMGRFCVGLIALLVCAFAPSMVAQTCQVTQLRVHVRDSQESPIYDVQVRIQSGDAQPLDRSTGTSGSADFDDIACGSYSITANKQGFAEKTATAEAGKSPIADVTLVLEPMMQHSEVEVKDTAPRIEQSSSENNELRPSEMKPLPTSPRNVSDTLPLVPGIVRSPDGELKLDGQGEQRSSLVVNQSDVTDPATGKFGQTVPEDSVETVNVLSTPFLAQYGRFTQTVVAVETKRGGEKWHGDLNDPFPDFRIRSYHMRGIRNETPRGVLGGPLIHNRLYVNSALQYLLDKVQSRTLGFPYNESKQERYNSFTQLDFIASQRQIITATLHISPQHINFVNPDYFSPQPTTPTYAQHNYIGTAADHLAVLGGMLDSSISFQRFSAYIGPQGSADMILTPTGKAGNYFATQNRDSRRTEWLELFSPKPLTFAGSHLFKIGNSVTSAGNHGQFVFHPIDIDDQNGRLRQRTTFTNPLPFNRTDLEVTAYVQDHWALARRFSIDMGGRIEHQQIASSLRIAPRTGFAWTPFGNERTVFRAGYGQFYDHIPLDVYTFGRYPLRTITNYASDGSIISGPTQYINTIGELNGPRSFLVQGRIVAGDFSPRGTTWNVQLEHVFPKLLRFRAVYTDNRSVGLIVVDPNFRAGEIVLNGNGESRFKQLELTTKATWNHDGQLVFSYTHSRTEGNLNEFDNFLGNFPAGPVRPDVYTFLPGDIRNRLVVWGHVDPHLQNFQIYPIVEYRNGFPYATFDALQRYVGMPYSAATRFPNFFSADARLSRDFKVNPKYTVRLSVTAFNLTNHFNALAVHSNTADPYYGTFFGNYHRRYRFDFEIVY